MRTIRPLALAAALCAASAGAAPVVLLKLDDLTQKGADAAKGEAVSAAFRETADLIRRLDVKASFGIICNSLETGTPEYFGWIKSLHDEGRFEFWCHGLTHAEYPAKNGRRHCEFFQATAEEQTASLRRCQDLAREKLGFPFACFGAPFNQTDDATIKVLDESFPEIASWFFGPPKGGSPARRVLERRINLEEPIFKPNAAHLEKEFDAWAKDLQYIVLQGHPNSWGGKQRAEFAKCVRFLKDRGCRFLTPSEFLAEPLLAPSLPWPPKPAAAPKADAPAAPKGKGAPPAPNPPSGAPPAAEPEARPQFLGNPSLLDADGDGRPDGWFRTTGDAMGSAWTGTDPDGTRFVRLEALKKDDGVILQRFAPLPDGAENVTVAARVRWRGIRRGAKSYMSGCVQAMFANEKNAKVGDFLPVANFLGDSGDGWRTVARTFPRPSGATRLRVQLALYSVEAGSLDVAWATAAAGDRPALPGDTAGAAAPAETSVPASLLGDDPLGALRPQGRTDLFDTTRETSPESLRPLLRVDVRRGARAAWDAQLRAKCVAPVRKGDVLSLSYRVRGVRTDSEIAEVTFLNAVQLDRAPWTKVFEERPVYPIPDGWTLHRSVHVSPESFAAGEWVLNFQFGGIDPECFELADLSFVNHGPNVDPASLPRSPPRRYRGHEPDAPWRAEALARIDRIRKAGLDVSVVDAAGRPVPDAEVRVEMKRHAFGWGTALNGPMWASNGEDGRRYREAFLSLFNLMVPENGLKWPQWAKPETRGTTLRMIDWAREHGCGVRGHTLVWPSFGRNPESVARLKDDPAALRAALAGRIADVAGATRGKIRAWDVMNEPTTNFDFMRILGDDAPAEWFRLAHEADPDAQLFLNENQVLAGSKLQSLEYWLDRVVAGDGPLGGIGIQGHLGYGTAAPERMLEIFARLGGKYGVPVSVTELDVNTKNEEDQAAYLRDVLIAAFSSPEVDSVTFWGFWDGKHWLGNSPLFRKDWTEKPGLKVYRQLVLDRWRTHETLRTGPDGHARLRGFLGDYEFSATAPGGATARAAAALPATGATVEIRLP